MHPTPQIARIVLSKLHLPLFEEGRFTATKFDSSADKAKFANHLLRFIGRGFLESSFSQSFYSRLSMCFSHIAHYNKHGFWDDYFTSTDSRIEFLNDTLHGGGYGDPAWTYCDVELAIRKRLQDARMLETYRDARATEIRDAEREMLRRLKAQYEPEPAQTLSLVAMPATVQHGPPVQLGLF